MKATITSGGIVTQLHVPDKNGNLGDVVLGYDKLSSYIKASPYFGCITGRYTNGIAKGQFKIMARPINWLLIMETTTFMVEMLDLISASGKLQR